jgi:hypothetical protein
MSDNKDPRAGRYLGREPDMHTADTAPARGAVSQAEADAARRKAGPMPRHEPRTLADLDESIGIRIANFVAAFKEDARAYRQSTDAKLDAFADRLGAIESERGAERMRRPSLSNHDLAALAEQVQNMSCKLDAQPNSADAAKEIKQASADAGAELAGLIGDIRGKVRVWGAVAALSFGAVAGVSTWFASKGTAKEAATEAVRSAPREQERVIVVTQPAPGLPAPQPQGAPNP